MRILLRLAIIGLSFIACSCSATTPPPALHLNQARFGHVAALVGDDIYVLAGHDNEATIGTIERIPANRSRVETIDTKITPRYWLGGTSDGKTIYLAGGVAAGGATTALFESWRPGDKTARQLAPMPEARSRFDLVLYKKRLYAIGGTDDNSVRSRRVDIYDIATDKWSRGADMPYAREGDAELLDGRIVLPGGYDGKTSLASVLSYDPRKDTWSETPPLDLPQSAQHLAAVNGTLYAFGHYNQLERVTTRDPKTGRWSILDLPFSPTRHSDVVFDRKEIFVIGGNTQSRSGALDLVQRYPRTVLAAAHRRAPTDTEWASARRKDGAALDPAATALITRWGDTLARLKRLTISRETVYSPEGKTSRKTDALEFAWQPGNFRLSNSRFNVVFDGTEVRSEITRPKAALEAPAQNPEAALLAAGVKSGFLDVDLNALTVGNVSKSLLDAVRGEDWRVRPDETINGATCWVLFSKLTESGSTYNTTLHIDQSTGVIVRRVTEAEIPSESTPTKPEHYRVESNATKADTLAEIPADVFSWRPAKELRRIADLSALRASPPPDALIGKPAPDFTYTLLDGSSLRLADLRGKVVVIDFWATWCGPCVRAMPEVQKLHETYRDKGVVVIGLSTEDASAEKKVRSMVEKLKITYAIAFGADNTANDYGVRGIPNLVIIGPDGTVKARHIGFSPDLAARVASDINKNLAVEPSAPVASP